jgi:hypothetical protein
VLNILSTLSSMLTTAKNWGYSVREIELEKLVLPERNSFVAPHFTLAQVESILGLAREPCGKVTSSPRSSTRREAGIPSSSRFCSLKRMSPD